MAIERLGDTAQLRFSVGELKDNQLRVLRFRADEGISKLFEVDFELVSEDASIQFDAVMGQPAAFVIDLGDEPRYVNGIVTRFEQGAIGKRYTRYYARMAPRTWLLHHRVNSRIWENTSVLDVIDDVLEAADIPSDTVDWRIPQSERGDSGRYKPREYCVQYSESDWDFVSRLCEEEGIAYWFEHTQDQHKLVLADNTSAHTPIAGNATVPYRDPSGTVVEGEYVGQFRRSESMRPGAVVVRDFCFKTPRVGLDGRATGDDRDDDDREIFEYPGGHHDSDLGTRRAGVRLEEHQALRRVGNGESVCQRLTPGHRFTLSDHGRDDFNTEYLLTDVVHEGFQPQVFEQEQPEPGGEEEYQNSFRCIPAGVAYRPMRVTPRPRIRGPQSAVVVGPADSDEEIYTDEYGRVRVRFHWDRADEGKSSCWVRVSQQWAGPGYGFLTLPRVGHEVVVAFFEGDPDQPHVVGRVYNADNMPPYALPDHKTRSTIKTASSPGGEGFNEIRFEDKKDEEQIFLHAQKRMDVRVLENSYETVKGDRHLVVEGNRLEHVKSDRHVVVDGTHKENVSGDVHVSISGNHAMEVGADGSLIVSGNLAAEISGKHTESISGDLGFDVSGKIALVASGGITLQCGGSEVVIGSSGVTIKGSQVVVDGSTVRIASGPGSPAQTVAGASTTSPEAPDVAEDAAEAEAGGVAQAQGAGETPAPSSSSAASIAPLQRDDSAGQGERDWVSIELKDEDGNPLAGELYQVRLADGSVRSGRLDQEGKARLEGISEGDCEINFPRIDGAEWRKA